MLALASLSWFWLQADKRSWKNGFFQAIVTLILEAGGRFLRKEKGGDWKEAGQDEARKKVGQQFRDAARKPILERFSLVDAARAGMKIPYYSPYSFDWTGIGKNCRRELLDSNQCYRYLVVENSQKKDGGDSVESILGKMFREPWSDMQRSSFHSIVGSSPSCFSSMSIHPTGLSMD